MTSRKFFCTFPQELISEPLISHTLGVKFDVVPNIRAATISESQAHVVVEIEGEAGRIEESVVYLKDRGVAVKELAEGEDPPRVLGSSCCPRSAPQRAVSCCSGRRAPPSTRSARWTIGEAPRGGLS